MSEAQRYERIESYLSGQMPPEEAAAFRREMEADPGLEAEVALHRGIAEAVIEEEDVQDLEGKIGAILEKGRGEAAGLAARRRFLSRPLLRVAASAALLIVAALAAYFYLSRADDSPEALFAEYVSYPESIYEASTVRSAEGQTPERAAQASRLDSLWKAADALYRQGRYQEALGVLDKTGRPENGPLSGNASRLYYYRGILQARAGQFAGAVSSFEQVAVEYNEDADWKRALALLRLEGRREEAVALLREISDSDTPQKDRARVLLERLGEE